MVCPGIMSIFILFWSWADKLLCSREDKTYHIISSDKGYDGVIRTLKVLPSVVMYQKVLLLPGESGADKSNCLKQPSVPESDIVSRWAGKLQQIASSGAGNNACVVETFNNYLKSHA
ncbi:hypothetical protein BANRA_05624 [Escherichia coli]|uniref:Uncharacterized protein n=1 Tax=Escherichia coli TaxID=562 RepID=A0A3P5HED1_ECOLX|nr:hypothetical protein BANRA_05624 [Escherichia coli]